MKRKDIKAIIVIVILSGVFSYLLSNAIFNKSRLHKEKVEVVQVIKSDFITPDSKYFNPNSINPTKKITIGNTTNPEPFHGN